PPGACEGEEQSHDGTRRRRRSSSRDSSNSFRNSNRDGSSDNSGVISPREDCSPTPEGDAATSAAAVVIGETAHQCDDGDDPDYQQEDVATKSTPKLSDGNGERRAAGDCDFAFSGPCQQSY
ncbi:unnamed protein product, partial [Sphacelaria rigidula]